MMEGYALKTTTTVMVRVENSEMDVDAINLGKCQLLLKKRILMADGKPAQIGSRALDILLYLARRQGQTISIDELMKAVWPNTTVEQNTLRVQIKNLRRALTESGSGCFVVNRSGRGYSLIVPTQRMGLRLSSELAETTSALPKRRRLIGRAGTISEVTERLLNHQLVTVTGPGGIGKTGVVKEIAARWDSWGRREVFYIDLGGLQDERLLLAHVARAVGVKQSDADPREVLRTLSGVNGLLVLDTCEHMIDAAAEFVEQLLPEAPNLKVLVGSQDSLRIAGEWVTRLQPLAFPQTDEADELVTAEAYPAIELFLERASGAGCALTLAPATIGAIGRICARLDGLPLAIELAAARVGQFGVDHLLSALNQHLGILTGGLRTGVPRQRTMRAAIEWSFSTLTDYEQELLQNLSVLKSPFVLEIATAVAGEGHPEVADQDVMNGLNELYRKSMLNVVIVDDRQHFCLLDTTRTYAYELLRRRGGEDIARSRHLTYVQNMLRQRRESSFVCPTLQSEHELNEVRGALDWASEHGELMETVANLTLAAIPMWFEHSLVGECRMYVERILSKMSDRGAGDARILQFYVALGGAYMNIQGAGEDARSAWTEVYRQAGRTGDIGNRLKSLWGLWVDARNRGDFVSASILSKRFTRLSRKSNDPLVLVNADRMSSISHFFQGELALSRRLAERVASSPHAGRDVVSFQFHQRITARCFLAQALWLQGFADKAIGLAIGNVEDAIAIGHSATISYALTEGGCQVAWNVGNLSLLEHYSQLALCRTARNGLDVWHTIAGCFSGILQLKRGNDVGLEILHDALGQLRRAHRAPVCSRALAFYADELAKRGRAGEAIAAIEEALSRARLSGEKWCEPELLRLRGVIRKRFGLPYETDLHASMALCRQQGALGWQLRTATSLAEHYLDRGDERAAVSCLIDIYGSFDEGSGSEDLRKAEALLDQFRQRLAVG
ncbi:winged helix-turn-helix domain-containing protein [Agrobacterium genomosp. 13]|uniref:Transcriptional regulator, winged helix family n=1 Tax=Agrobacterium genomosp. 13 str. CFBP 6927 TaxID=1183428 RepID=A0ABM9VL59_9HYPH|nr:winged helix-turn-helix domain-containing protein [Agrobacterium genomosp. 13]CUX57882.1 putative Transcriptional regulator, winged helix family [Agrobacterium genomosp. 13 str. CFBP 6927]